MPAEVERGTHHAPLHLAAPEPRLHLARAGANHVPSPSQFLGERRIPEARVHLQII